MQTYDPEKVNIVVAGNTITGFAPGTFVKVTRDEEAFQKVTGAGGDVCRVKNANKGGKIELTLMQSSPSNAVLSAQAALDEASGAGVGEAQITDGTSDATLAHAQSAWVQKQADLERGKELAEVPWVIDCAKVEIYVAGVNDPQA